MSETPVPGTVDIEYTPPPRTSVAALSSLLLGIFGLCLPLLGPLGAILFGVIGHANVRREPARLTGRGLAVAGIVLGILGFLIHVVAGALFGWGMKISYDAVRQIQAIEAPAGRGDWDRVAQEFTGPESIPQSELSAKLSAFGKTYGRPATWELAEADRDAGGWSDLPMKLVVNLSCERGDAHAVIRVKHVGNRFLVTGLEYADGLVHVKTKSKSYGTIPR